MTRVYESFANPSIAVVGQVLDLRHELLQCDWLIGKSAHKAGWVEGPNKASFGRTYDDIACCVWRPWQYTNDLPYIVLPTERDVNGYDNCRPQIIVHELGHVLHRHLNLEWFGFDPVSWYATTNYYENFTESFTSWLVEHYEGWNIDTQLMEVNKKPCEQATAFFESLGLLRGDKPLTSIRL
jgi:hypothetical protein